MKRITDDYPNLVQLLPNHNITKSIILSLHRRSRDHELLLGSPINTIGSKNTVIASHGTTRILATSPISHKVGNNDDVHGPQQRRKTVNRWYGSAGKTTVTMTCQAPQVIMYPTEESGGR